MKQCTVITSPYSWGGGIKTMIDDAISAITDSGYYVNLVMPDYNPGLNMFKGSYKRQVNSLNYSVVPTTAYPKFDDNPYLHHQIFGLKAKYIPKKTDVSLAVLATSHTALPLLMSGKPYFLWTATLYSDELESKYNSLIGDEPAQRLRMSKLWSKLEKLEGQVYKGAEKIFALSDYTADKIARTFGLGSDQIEVLNPPIEFELFSYSPLPEGDPRIIYTGRLDDPRKNIKFLLESFKLVLNSIPTAKLILVGDNPNNSIKNFVKNLGLNEQVNVLPFLERHELPRILKKAHLFAATPIQEGLGISTLEAMASGLPVVITKCGGSDSIIAKSGGGLVIDGTIEDYAQAVLNLLSNRKELDRKSKAGSYYIRKHFSYFGFRKQLANSLDEIGH